MQIDTGTAKRKRSVSMVPLIDVVFILLLFFMLSTSLVKGREVGVDFPAVTAAPVDVEVRTLRLETEGGVVTYEGELLDTSDPTALNELRGTDQNMVYAIDTAPGVTTQALVALLDRMKNAGIENVSIVESEQ